MSEWRPEGWENPLDYTSHLGIQDIIDGQKLAYEVGADAMLAGIWKMARESCTGTFVFDTHYFGNHAVVFPKDEETPETP